MRADMGGAACTVGTLYTGVKLKVHTHYFVIFSDIVEVYLSSLASVWTR